jgi:hypothetical protein
MKKNHLGILMLVICILLCIIGFMMGTTNGDVYNIGLMHRQTIVFIVSGFLFLGSLIVLLVGGDKSDIGKDFVDFFKYVFEVILWIILGVIVIVGILYLIYANKHRVSEEHNYWSKTPAEYVPF